VLVLERIERRVREDRCAIMIGDDIEIVVTGIRGDRVKLGIIAPPGVRVHRTEVWRRIRAEAARISERKGNAG